MEREIRIHSQLFHQNIVSLYAAFEDADHVYLARSTLLVRTLHQYLIQLRRWNG